MASNATLFFNQSFGDLKYRELFQNLRLPPGDVAGD